MLWPQASPQLFTLHGVVSSSKSPNHDGLSADVAKLGSELGVLCEVTKIPQSKLATRISELSVSKDIKVQR